MTTQHTYRVRVGDDGRFLLTTTDSLEARQFAWNLSMEASNWLKQAYIQVDGRNEARYRNGKVDWTSKAWESLL